MKRAKLETKSKKATPARKPASPRIRTPAETKSAKAKKVSAPKNKSVTVAKRKKTAAPAKQLAKKPVPGVRSSSGAATRQAKSSRTVRAPLKLKVAAPVAKRISPKPRTKLKAAPKRKIASRVTPTKSPLKLSVRKPALPAFLLEGDEPSFLTEAGAAEKFALGPTAPPDHFDEGNVPLPSSYGTGKLFLTARDPHWLYAHWDFTHEEQFHHNAKSIDRHLILRLHDEAQPQKYIAEIHVHPESKHWFVHVEQAGQTYSTELGYYRAGHKWKSLATSATQRTPPDNISGNSTVEFATIPLELSFETMLALLKEHSGGGSRQNFPLARAIEIIRPLICENFPDAIQIADWTTDQEQSLAGILAASGDGIGLPSSQDSPRRKNVADNEPPFVDSSSSYTSSFFGGTEN